jgi:outer membrane murein-binding lipoprotein Lpp
MVRLFSIVLVLLLSIALASAYHGAAYSGGAGRFIVVLDADDLIDLVVRGYPRDSAVEVMRQIAMDSQRLVEDRLSMLGARVINRLWLVNALVIEADERAIPMIARIPGVKAIYPDERIMLIDDVDATAYQDLKPLDSVSRRIVQADLLEAMGINGSGIKVAVLDTGIQNNHPWLIRGGRSVVAAEYDATGTGVRDYCVDTRGRPNDHGTLVASVIASQHSLHRGVAPGVTLYDVIVFSHIRDCRNALGSWVIDGIQWAVSRGVDIISMSLGVLLSIPDAYRVSIQQDLVLQAISRAASLGIVVVVAAGNEGPGFYTTNYYCLVEDVICVAASDSTSGSIDRSFTANFSSRGPAVFDVIKPDVAAPGVAVIGASVPNTSKPASGTSIATPHVSGIAALLKQAGMQAREIKRAIVETAILMQRSEFYRSPNPFEQGGGLAAALNALLTPIRLAIDGGSEMGTRKTVVADPGSNVTIRLAVMNIGNTSIAISLDAIGFENYLGYSSIPRSMITFSPSTLDLSPGASSTVNVTISIPSDTPPGTYAGYLVASSGNYSAKAMLAIAVRAKIQTDAPLVLRGSAGGFIFSPTSAIAYRFKVDTPTKPLAVISIMMPTAVATKFYVLTPRGDLISAVNGFRFSDAGEYILAVELSYRGVLIGVGYTMSIEIYDFQEIMRTISILNTSISNIRSDVNSLKSNVTAIAGRVDSLSGNVSSLASMFTAFQRETRSSIEDLRLNLSTLSSRLADLSRGFEDLQQSTDKALKDLTDSVASIGASLDDLRKGLASTQQNISSISRDIQSLRNKLGSLESDLRAMETRVGDALSQVNLMAIIAILVGAIGMAMGIAALIRKR